MFNSIKNFLSSAFTAISNFFQDVTVMLKFAVSNFRELFAESRLLQFCLLLNILNSGLFGIVLFAFSMAFGMLLASIYWVLTNSHESIQKQFA